MRNLSFILGAVCLWSTLLSGQSHHRKDTRFQIFFQGGWSLPSGSFRAGDFLEAPLFEETFPNAEETAEAGLGAGWQAQLLLVGHMSPNLGWGVRAGVSSFSLRSEGFQRTLTPPNAPTQFFHLGAAQPLRTGFFLTGPYLSFAFQNWIFTANPTIGMGRLFPFHLELLDNALPNDGYRMQVLKDLNFAFGIHAGLRYSLGKNIFLGAEIGYLHLPLEQFVELYDRADGSLFSQQVQPEFVGKSWSLGFGIGYRI